MPGRIANYVVFRPLFFFIFFFCFWQHVPSVAKRCYFSRAFRRREKQTYYYVFVHVININVYFIFISHYKYYSVTTRARAHTHLCRTTKPFF